MSDNDIAMYVGYKGFSIYKNNISVEEEQMLRKELNVKPFVPKSSLIKPQAFPVYRESSTKIYVPRFYGLEVYGEADEMRIKDGKKINLKFNGELRPKQKPVVEKYMKHIKRNHSGLLSLHTGWGKTIAALNIISRINQKTLIIVHKEFLLRQWVERIEQFLPDARVGRIQAKTIDTEDKDIVICMLQSLSMKDYPKDMFKEYGLSIYDECFPFKTKIQTDKGLINIGSLYEKWNNKEELPKVLSFNKEKEKFEYKQMSYAWRKERKDLIKIKMSKRVINCTPEHKILTKNGYIEANKLKVGDLIISKYDRTHIDNIISQGLNDDQLQLVYGSYLGDGHIAITKKNRYRLRIIHCEKQKDYCEWKADMFGIKELKYIEKNGYSQKPAYNFQTKIFDLEDEITKNTKTVPDWLLDKLDIRGIAIWYMDDGTINKRELKDGSISNYISIHSNNFDFDTHIKFVKKFERYGIKCIINKTKGKYYYLRFNKENTLKLLNLIKPYIHKSMHYKINDRNDIYNWSNKFLDYGYLKVTSINYFENKGANRCKKPYVYDIEVKDNHNFVIGTSKKYVDGPVVSNCHHLSAEVFSRAFFKVVTKYGLGLSATMKRKDGLTKVLKWFLGPIVCKVERKGEDNVLVKVINYETNDEDFNRVERDYRGQVKYTTMVKKLCEFNRRSEFILKVLSNLLKKNRDQQIMILGHQKKLLKYLHDAIKHRTIATVGYYVGGMKEEDLKKTEGKKVVIATYAMAEEGLDIKTLSTLIMATPKVDVTQSVGRILRKKHKQAIVVDIVDSHSLFQRHFAKRKTFYRKSKFKIEQTDMEGYEKDDWDVIYDPVNKIKKAFEKKVKKDELLQGVCLITD